MGEKVNLLLGGYNLVPITKFSQAMLNTNYSVLILGSDHVHGPNARRIWKVLMRQNQSRICTWVPSSGMGPSSGLYRPCPPICTMPTSRGFGFIIRVICFGLSKIGPSKASLPTLYSLPLTTLLREGVWTLPFWHRARFVEYHLGRTAFAA